jgi:anti-sigma B factor antagonist
MKISEREKNGIIILDITGEIKFANVPILKECLSKLYSENKFNVLLNFEDVKEVDSSGIGALIQNFSSYKKKNGAIKFLNVGDTIFTLFKITKLDRIFDIFDTEEDALKSFK